MFRVLADARYIFVHMYKRIKMMDEQFVLKGGQRSSRYGFGPCVHLMRLLRPASDRPITRSARHTRMTAEHQWLTAGGTQLAADLFLWRMIARATKVRENDAALACSGYTPKLAALRADSREHKYH